MKATTLIGIGLALVLVLGLAGGGGGPSQEVPAEEPREAAMEEAELALDDEATMALVRANNDFAFHLYAALESREGNLFISPYSVSSALAMAFAGARGETAAQMAEVLRYSAVAEQLQLHTAFAALNRALGREGEGYRLSVANALWGQEGADFFSEYIDIVDKYYGSGINTVDYTNRTEEARLTINRWIEDRPGGKIVDMLQPGSLSPLTRLVLTNAVHFKGQWTNKFVPSDTRVGAFYLSESEQVDVPFMRQTEDFQYADIGHAQVLELPYGDGQLARMVVLPKAGVGLAEGEAELVAGGLEPVVEMLSERRVSVILPRFKVEDELALGEVLRELGMVDAFDERRADFSGMSSMELHISEVMHKAFIDVDEEGTEAAAATGVVMTVTSVRVDEPVEFRADRPFFFAIRDVESGSVLFMGRVTDPR